ncbi:DUF362 domain-containing protein [Sedimentibacter sp. zth1]|uniref:DUF362 domain-containing protein n=1 Tax=Sedimentibacter sp. zth1 TaxID=2816908 RepID=UPI001A91DF3A|nr:DUF362 domain-containing protein [Sedimentibacter sp. zth1]QSX06765.1 DUF362 domain-containing protein [Sedimentibacter sp. zth1]
MSKICAVDASSYEINTVQKAIDRLFEIIELNSLVKPNYKVLIKPNLLMKRKPAEATTTHPTIILAIVNRLKALGVDNIVIADSPAGLYTKQALKDIYKVCGMQDVSIKSGAKLNTNVEYDTKYIKEGKACKTFNIIKPIHDADFIISVGKVKTHGMTTMSGAVKNIFGSIPGLQKPEMHCRFNVLDQFSEMLVDLALCVKPNISIMDGIVCMEGDGPSGGTPKTCNFIAGSQNPFELDVFLAKKIGLEPKSVPTIVASSERGLCDISGNDLDFIGDEDALKPINDFKLPKSVSVDFVNFVPKIFRRPSNFVLNKFLVSRPVINTDKCVGCGKCAESCPQNTIEIINGKAVIDYRKCIKCFCCHEMCPVKAIDMKRRLNI